MRRELASTLVVAGKNQQALDMYRGLSLSGEDHLQLVVIHAALKNFKNAAEQARQVLEMKPDDEEAKRWLAKVTLWGGDPANALVQLQPLLEEKFDQPELWVTFVDAAAAVRALTPTQRKLVLRIGAEPVKGTRNNISHLTRLAWVLFREATAAKDNALLAQANRFLDEAVAMKPLAVTERKELAGVLAVAGKVDEALAQLDGLPKLEPEEQFLLVSLLSAKRTSPPPRRRRARWSPRTRRPAGQVRAGERTGLERQVRRVRPFVP